MSTTTSKHEADRAELAARAAARDTEDRDNWSRIIEAAEGTGTRKADA